MEDKNVVHELMKEYHINVPGMDEPVRAKIWKEIRGDDDDIYVYSFSHYFWPGEGAIEPVPEIIGRRDFRQAEIITLQHLEDFTIEFGDPVKNKFFY